MSTINFTCYACNQVLKVGADKAGKKAKCIQCGTILTIPVASTTEAVQEAPAPSSKSGAAPPPPPRAEDDDRPRKRRRDEEEDERDDERPRKKRRRDEDDEDDDDRPRKKRRNDDDEYDDDRPRKKRRDDDDEDDDDRPRKKRRDDDDDYESSKGAWKDNWPKVNLGCLLTFIGLCVYAGAYALENIGVLILTISSFGTGGGGSSTLLDFIKILLRIGVTVIPLTIICALVGHVFWFFVTNKHGKMAFAIAASAVGLIAMVFLLVFKVIPIFDQLFIFSVPYGPFILLSRDANIFRNAGPSYAATILPTLVNLLVAAWFMMVAFYTRGVGKSLKDRSLAARSMLAIIVGGVAAGYQVIWPALTRAFASSQSGGKGMLALVWVIFWIGIGLNVFVIILTLINVKNAKNAADR